jgi:hypothetical protein
MTAGMGLVGAVTSLIGCFFFLYLQNRFNFSTKTNLMIIVTGTGRRVVSLLRVLVLMISLFLLKR